MKRLSLVTGLLLCLLSLLARPARADSLATILFTMPSNVDPAELFLTQEGHTYTIYGPNETPISGSTLLSSSDGGADGLEVHGQLPTNIANVYTPVRELWLATNYDGTIQIQQNNGTFQPWSVTEATNGPEHIFKFQWNNVNQAELNDSGGGFTGLFTASLNGMDTHDFAGAYFHVTGFSSPQSVPEAGTVVEFGILLALGAAGLRPRRGSGAHAAGPAPTPPAPR